MRAEQPAARHEPASDDMHPIVSALIIDTLPTPVMTFPLELLAGLRPLVWFAFGSLSGTFFLSIVRSRRATPHGNATPIPIPVHQQANKSRSHLPMSVKQNLVTDRAREFRAHFKNTQARCIGNGNSARDCSARRAIAAAATVSSSTTGQQLVDESLGISESNFKFRRGATPKYLILLGAMGTPFAQGFPGPAPRFDVKSLLRQKNSCSIIVGSHSEKHALA